MNEQRKCNLCGKEYESKRFWSRFCSYKCRQAAYGVRRSEAIKKEALDFANKAMKKTLIVIGLLMVGAQSLIAQTITGTASYYGIEACRYNKTKGCLMANGESLYDYTESGDYAAMWGIKFGTRIKVTNQANRRSVISTVRDRGPAKRLKRAVDLSPGTFAEIASLKQGIIDVEIEVLN